MMVSPALRLKRHNAVIIDKTAKLKGMMTLPMESNRLLFRPDCDGDLPLLESQPSNPDVMRTGGRAS